MCSIIGITSPTSKALDATDFRNLKQLIKLNQHRGGHGAGVWSEGSGLVKSPKLDAISETMSRKGEKNILIHLRYATSATKVAKYNHPFMEKHVVFVHNGHITNFKKFDVPMDSMAGLKAILQGNEAMRDLEGWYVFVWYNLKTKRVHVLNQSGSIQYGWLNGKLYLASIGLEEVIPSAKVIESGQHLVFDYTTPKLVHLNSARAFTPKTEVVRFGFGSKSYPTVSVPPLRTSHVDDDGGSDFDQYVPLWLRHEPIRYLPAKYRIADLKKSNMGK